MESECPQQMLTFKPPQLDNIFAAELFSKLDQADKERVISLIKSLLSQK